MSWFHWITLSALAVCLVSLLYHLIRLIHLGKPKDRSRKSGRIAPAVIYSFTSAMSPASKESAFLHLPTYTAGIIYHIATCISLAVFVPIFLGMSLPAMPGYLLAFVAFAGSASGWAILIKRISDKKLRKLSNPDDYLSNVLVNVFQLLTGLTLLNSALLPVFLLSAALLFLYMPVGKLKHMIYFFAARYHLGFFYGWRNVWPPR
ncbi:MAG: hypothetical protein RG741_01020 [Bacteroidales bacterium]|nr:hypothetical protein [Bacteroidales bacterium]